MIAIGGPTSAPVILDRRRIELIEAKIPRQPYHASESLELAKAEKIIHSSIETATRLCGDAIKDVLKQLGDRDYQVHSVGIVLASGRPLPELAKILASHALIHTAEGELFRDAIAQAASENSLAVVKAKEREVNSHRNSVAEELMGEHSKKTARDRKAHGVSMGTRSKTSNFGSVARS